MWPDMAAQGRYGQTWPLEAKCSQTWPPEANVARHGHSRPNVAGTASGSGEGERWLGNVGERCIVYIRHLAQALEGEGCDAREPPE